MAMDAETIKRLADQACSSHAALRDRYEVAAFLLDISILLLTLWLTALALASPAVIERLSPAHVPKEIWMGLLSIVAFALAIIQLRVDWKARTDSHKRAVQEYSSIKREAGEVLMANDSIRLGEL